MKNLKKVENELTENELIERAQKGDVWARNQVIELNMSLVRKIASKSIQKSSLPDSDLIQEGIFGIVTAIEKFDVKLEHSEFGPKLIGSYEELEKAKAFLANAIQERLKELEG